MPAETYYPLIMFRDSGRALAHFWMPRFFGRVTAPEDEVFATLYSDIEKASQSFHAQSNSG